jgi:hypothetical protein
LPATARDRPGTDHPRRDGDRAQGARLRWVAAETAVAQEGDHLPGDTSIVLWLAATTTWSARPSSRVSATATVPSLSPSKPPKNCPSPSGMRPAIIPTSARPRQGLQPHRSSSALPPSARPAQA